MKEHLNVREPIAIIGFGCRFPGGVFDGDSYWDLMASGTDAIKDIPSDRWDADSFFHENPDFPGRYYVKQGGFLDIEIDKFDPLAFGISPREATQLDPQQRLLLEITWEAFENAGMGTHAVAGSKTGVFIGGFCLDNMVTVMNLANRHQIDLHTAASSTMTILANRISHAFDLRGPSVSSDTACSSSLVSTHLACQSLLNGDSDVAIAGGVNMMLRPETFIVMSKGRFLSPLARCMTFDERAAGYVRGEGAGVVVLKKLSRAQQDGDRIRALILSSGINQDGRTPGISMPNSEAQIELMQTVLARAGLHGKDIDYVEAHGTGTQAGDPKEAHAINTVFGQERTKEQECIVGSVKTNIGHLEAAAGIASLIKGTLCLEHGAVPPNLHFKNPNPDIPLQDWSIKIPTALTDLPHEKAPHYTAINSFGYGGTNANVILSAAEYGYKSRSTNSAHVQNVKQIDIKKEPLFSLTALPFYMLPISAMHENSLKKMAQDYQKVIQDNQVSFEDLLYSAALRRSHLKNRLLVFGNSASACAEQLALFNKGEITKQCYQGETISNTDAFFVFSGIGPQWLGMGQELIKTLPDFAECVKACDAVFTQIAGWSIWQAMIASKDSKYDMSKPDIAQPANTVLQIALYDCLRKRGMKPSAVLGHSAGEMAAAYASGALSMDDALFVSITRSRLQALCANSGSMLAVGLSEHDAHSLMERYTDLDIAAINGPTSVTIAGPVSSLEALSEHLKQQEIFQRFLNVTVPYHSRKLEMIRDRLLKRLASIQPRSTDIPLYSTVTADIIDGKDLNAEYWWKNVRQPVQFYRTIEKVFASGYQLFIEFSPHPVLSQSVKEIAFHQNHAVVVIPTLRRGTDELHQLHSTMAQYFCHGGTLNWDYFAPEHGKLVALPRYAWNRSKYWKESQDANFLAPKKANSPLLQIRLHHVPQMTWQSDLSKTTFPAFYQHRIEAQSVFPGSGFVEGILETAAYLREKQFPLVIRELHFDNMLILEEDVEQSLITDYNEREGRVSLYSKRSGDDVLQKHATGRIYRSNLEIAEKKIKLEELKARIACKQNIAQMYDWLSQCGMNYGKLFQQVKTLFTNENEALAALSFPTDSQSTNFLLHPILLDSAMHPLVLINTQDMRRSLVPIVIEQLTLHAAITEDCWCYVRTLEKQKTQIICELTIFDKAGTILFEAKGVRAQFLTSHDKSSDKVKQLSYQINWDAIPSKHAAITSLSDSVSGILLCDCLDQWVYDLETELDKNFIPTFKIGASRLDEVEFLDNNAVLHQTKEKHYQRALQKINQWPISHVIFCWPLRSKGNANQRVIYDDCLALVYLLRALEKRQNKPKEIIFITRFGQCVTEKQPPVELNNTVFSGLASLISNEFPNYHCRTIDLDAHSKLALHQILSINESDLALRDNRLYTPRIRSLNLENKRKHQIKTISTVTPVTLVQEKHGNVDSLHYQILDDANKTKSIQSREVEIRVSHVGINYKDMLKVYGSIATRSLEGTYCGENLGLEISGIVERTGNNSSFKKGDKVVGVVGTTSGFSSYVTIPDIFVFHKPDNIPFAQAPNFISFITAIHSLENLAKLQPGESILIHSAAGAVGLAAIQVAKRIGAKIYATAGTDEKRQHVNQLDVLHVMDSRSLTFAEEIRYRTHGKGVDVVLNSLGGEAQVVSMELLAPGGRFIELGKGEFIRDKAIPLSIFNQGGAFHSFDIDRLHRSHPEMIRSMIERLLKQLEIGEYTVTPTIEYSACDIKQAFRTVSRGSTIGRVVVKIQDEKIEALPQLRKKKLDNQGSYLITGGCKGFGLTVAKHLASQGVGELILVNRSGARDTQTQCEINDIAQKGVKVTPLALDVTEADDIEKLKRFVEKKALPLRGILHGAMVLEDLPVQQVTQQSLEKVLSPKIVGALNLANAFSKCNLDIFVMFSSVAAQVGNPGQYSYIAANSFLDGFAHALRQRGVNAVSISWGSLAESGVVANDKKIANYLEAQGIHGLSNAIATQGLDLALGFDQAQLFFCDFDWNAWHKHHPNTAHFSKFKEIAQHATKKKEHYFAWLDKIAGVSQEQSLAMLHDEMSDALGVILSIPKEALKKEQQLTELGIDSLMTIELTLAIKKRFSVDFSSVELARFKTLEECSQAIYVKLKDGSNIEQSTLEYAFGTQLTSDINEEVLETAI